MLIHFNLNSVKWGNSFRTIAHASKPKFVDVCSFFNDAFSYLTYVALNNAAVSKAVIGKCVEANHSNIMS